MRAEAEQNRGLPVYQPNAIIPVYQPNAFLPAYQPNAILPAYQPNALPLAQTGSQHIYSSSSGDA